MKVRIKFSKTGIIKYIGHLDLMRYFQKALRRTDICVTYSKGFSPHMIMSFAQPLGVGVESIGEYFDIEVDDGEDVSLFKDKLNAAMAEGIKIIDAYRLPEDSENAMASVKAADYIIDFYDNMPDLKLLKDTFENNDPITFEKKTKTGSREVNIKEYTFSFDKCSLDVLKVRYPESGSAELSGNEIVFLRLDSSSGGNLKPASFLDALFKASGLELNDFRFHVLRLDLLTERDNEFISLGKINE